jgi:hypothetical protein
MSLYRVTRYVVEYYEVEANSRKEAVAFPAENPSEIHVKKVTAKLKKERVRASGWSEHMENGGLLDWGPNNQK